MTVSKRNDAKETIEKFFAMEKLNPQKIRKMKNLAMKHNIKLGFYKKFFCKNCLSQLKGKIRIKKTHKVVFCEKCGQKNRLRI